MDSLIGQSPSECQEITSSGQKQLLCEALASLGGDAPSDIPFLVWLLENPDSPLALPGKIELYGHDCLHLLLNKGFSLADEAFVIGFTMGNDTKTQWFHIVIYRVISFFFYPQPYRFDQTHLQVFDLGLAYGRSLKIRNLNQLNFKAYQDQSVEALRRLLGMLTPPQPPAPAVSFGPSYF